MDTATARVLAAGLAAQGGGPVEIVDLRAEPFDGSSSFAAARILAVLGDGRSVPVFVKDLDPRNLLAEAKAVRSPGLERSRREVHLYRDVLPGLGIGTPTLYGVIWDEAAGRFLLLLEDAGPKRLSRLGNFRLWTAAAAWLGRFHASGRRSRPAWRLPSLRIEDVAGDARGARKALARLDPEARRATAAGLERLDGLLDRVWRAGHGLVHGEFFGKNIVIRPAPAAEPVAVIDWETAAIGPQVLDLVSISAGRWTADQRAALHRAYFVARAGFDPTVPAWEQFLGDVEAAAAVNALAWLGRWATADDAHVRRWGSEVASTVAALVDREAQAVR